MARTGGIIACGEEVIHFRSDHLLLRCYSGLLVRLVAGARKHPFSFMPSRVLSWEWDVLDGSQNLTVHT